MRPGYSLLERFRCGADTEGFTPTDFARGIDRIASLSAQEREEMGKRARELSLRYDFSVLTGELMQIIERFPE